MNKLIWLLKLSHGIEIGAINAYLGHVESLKNESVQKEILMIASEEVRHKRQVAEFLEILNSAPSPLINRIFSIVGHCMGFLCHYTGYYIPMLGAGLIETMGVVNYEIVAKEAFKQNQNRIGTILLEMAATELEHKNYFKRKAST